MRRWADTPWTTPTPPDTLFNARGSIPLQDICALMGEWEEAGYTPCDALIAGHLGASSVYIYRDLVVEG